MHIPTFNIPTIRQVQQFIPQGDYVFFPLILRIHICVFLLLSIIAIFYVFFGKINLICGRFAFRLATVPRVFAALTKPVLFHC